MKLFSQLSPKIGIDLGTDTVRICTEDGEVVVTEPTCIAVNSTTQEVVAVGTEAQKMEGRTDAVIGVHWPVKAGIVQDAAQVGALLKILLQPIIRFSILTPPSIMVSVPATATQVQRETVIQLLYDLGAKEVYSIAQPLAASIGAGVPIADASGSFVLHLGAGVVEAAVISLGSLVQVQRSSAAGRALQKSCMQAVQEEKELEISHSQATQLVEQVASCDPQFTADLLVMGKSAATGNPQELKITTTTLRASVHSIVEQYPQLIQRLLSKVGPALTVDIIDKGLLLTGGLAQLRGLEQYLIRELGMPVSVVEQPERAVITGISVTLKHVHQFRESLGYVN